MHKFVRGHKEAFCVGDCQVKELPFREVFVTNIFCVLWAMSTRLWIVTHLYKLSERGCKRNVATYTIVCPTPGDYVERWCGIEADCLIYNNTLLTTTAMLRGYSIRSRAILPHYRRLNQSRATAKCLVRTCEGIENEMSVFVVTGSRWSDTICFS